MDVFLDALAGVNEALRQSQTNVLALCAVMGGHSGVNPDAVGGDPSKISDQGPYWISSHHVYNQPQDPILNACKRLGLDNRPENHVQVIFDPALLDGNDGFLNMAVRGSAGGLPIWAFSPRGTSRGGIRRRKAPRTPSPP